MSEEYGNEKTQFKVSIIICSYHSYLLTPAFTMGGVQAAALQHERNDYFIFFKPFNWKIWVAMLSLWAFYSIILRFASFLSVKMKCSQDGKEDQFTLPQCFWYFSIVSLQFGTDRHPLSRCGKILQGFWSFFTLIFVATYTANLAAFFSEKHFFRPLNSIDDILSSNYTISTYSFMRNETFFQRNPILIQMMAENRVRFVDIDWGLDKEMIAKIGRELEAGHVWADYDTKFDWLRPHYGNLYVLDGYFSYSPYGFAMRSEWEWVNKVKQQFLWYSRSGFFNQIHRKYQTDKGADGQARVSQSIGMTGFLDVVLIMFGGGFLAIFALIFSSLRQSGGIDGDGSD